MGQRECIRLIHITTVPMTLAFIRGQIRLLGQRGVAVSVVSSPGPDLDSFAVCEGVPVYAVAMSRRITPFRDLVAASALGRYLRRARPHIVHAHTPKGGLLGMLAAWLARVPVRIYHMRGLPFTTSIGLRRILLRYAERVSCALAHRVICVSHSLREVALSEKLCSPERITVIAGGSGQGVDSHGRFDPSSLEPGVRQRIRARYGIAADALVVGFVGRVVRDKGVVELWEAWQILRGEFPIMNLLIVGPFEDTDPVPAYVREGLERDERVHLAGEDWNTPPFYAAMDLVVLPSYREGFPNVPLEAAAMRLPVVTTRVPGCVDAVQDGQTGALVAPRDAVDLARAVRSYADSAALRAAHGAAGRARVEQAFRQEVIWEGIFAEYDRMLEMARQNGATM